MQLSTPHNSDNLNDSRTEIPIVRKQELGEMASTSQSISYSLAINKEHTELIGSQVLNHNEDKDRQIQFLSNKLMESDKEANEFKKEIERLRNIIQHKNV